MFAILVSLMMLAAPLSPAGYHKGWAKKGKGVPPPASRPPVELVQPPYDGSGNQGGSVPSDPGERSQNRSAV
jgi:hypothetical protein